jgi:hypothetical protein
MANVCDFASELGKPNSPVRQRWIAHKSKESRLQEAKKFGLEGKDLAIVKKALDDDDDQPIGDACGEKAKGLWVK